MSTYIPVELIDMLRERRVIPFIGAGFSSGLGLPDWDTLLKQMCAEVSDIPSYDEIKKCCNSDYLQIAEYLYLKSDRSIGPLRHKLSALLHPQQKCIDSTPHVELVNLNAQQIYTTNYDEIIEKTFLELGQPYFFVALPKHLAGSNTSKTQVVKYHGDLRYDATLVLTESSYYSRLEFESPMDLKFRSDLLGQSVLFIGYSFRDINIRIIWFRLMEMMKDVPEPDRPSSYIVRFEKNEVLEDLYRAVGIKTIYLDPEGKATTLEEKNKILGRFLITLNMGVSAQGEMPESHQKMWMSRGVLEIIRESLQANEKVTFGFSRLNSTSDSLILYIEHAAQRCVPTALHSDVDKTISSAARGRFNIGPLMAKWAIKFVSSSNSNAPGAKFTIIRSLLNRPSRNVIFEHLSEIDWSAIWSTTISKTDGEMIMKILSNEIENQRHYPPDHDIAYASDVIKRMLNGTLKVSEFSDLETECFQLFNAASEIHLSIKNINPDPNGLTDLREVLSEIESKIPEEEDDIPF